MNFTTNFDLIFTFDDAMRLADGGTQLFMNFDYGHEQREIAEMDVYEIILGCLLNTQYDQSVLRQHLKKVSMCVRDTEYGVGAREMLVRCPWLANKYSPLYKGKMLFSTHKMEGYQPDPELFDLV